MIHWIAGKIISSFERNDVMEYDPSIYQHGLELILSYVLGTIPIIVFCLIFNFIWEGLLFVLFFESIRKYTGGFHANSYLACNVMYLGSFFIYYCLLSVAGIDMKILYILEALSIGIVLWLAPVEHINNPLSEKRKKAYRLISIMLSIAYVLIIGVVSLYNIYYAKALIWIVVLVGITVYVGELTKKKG